MAELRDLGGLLQRASFALPVADKSTKTVSFSNFKSLVSELRAMGETSSLQARQRCIPSAKLFSKTEQIYFDHFSKDNRLLATFEMIFLTGWAPDASQPKPLLPGSAKARLADALEVKEFRLPNTPRT